MTSTGNPGGGGTSCQLLPSRRSTSTSDGLRVLRRRSAHPVALHMSGSAAPLWTSRSPTGAVPAGSDLLGSSRGRSLGGRTRRCLGWSGSRRGYTVAATTSHNPVVTSNRGGADCIGVVGCNPGRVSNRSYPMMPQMVCGGSLIHNRVPMARAIDSQEVFYRLMT